MSKARSPRDVCSTTMGTRGLIGRAVYRSALASPRPARPPATAASRSTTATTAKTRRRASATRRPELAGLLRGGLLGPRRLALALLRGPDLLARRGAVHGDRLRGLGDHLGRLAHPDVVAKQRVTARLAQTGEQLLRRVLTLAGSNRLDQVLVRWLDRLGVGDRREHGLAAQRTLGVLFGVVDEVMSVLALHLGVGLGIDPARRQLALDPLPHLVRAGVDELVRDLDLRVRGHRVHRRLAKLGPRPLLESLRELRADRLAELLERLELRGLGGEVVIELWEALLAHLLHADREGGGLAGELLRAVVVREGDLDRLLLAARGAHERGIELRKQALGADLDHEVARLGPLERLAPDRAREVDHYGVPRRGGAIDGREACEALAQAVELRLERVGGHLDLGLADLEPLVLAELGLRPHTHLDREGERLALLRKVAKVELRVTDRLDTAVEQRALVPLGERVAKRLLDHRLTPDPLDHELRRDLALAKARQLHLARDRSRRPVDALRERVRFDRDVDLHARLRELGDGGLHGGTRP